MKKIMCVLCMLSVGYILPAQEDPAENLNEQFSELKKSSYDYQEYEVIDKRKLDNFWGVVQDSVQNLKQELQAVKNKVDNQEAEIKEINQTLAETREALEESQYASDRFNLLGIYILKSTFLTIISIIIGILVVLLVAIGIKFRVNEKVTQRKKRDYQELADEFEEYRRIVRQREIKIKRELQTERNKIEELKHKIK